MTNSIDKFHLGQLKDTAHDLKNIKWFLDIIWQEGGALTKGATIRAAWNEKKAELKSMGNISDYAKVFCWKNRDLARLAEQFRAVGLFEKIDAPLISLLGK